MPPYPKAQPTTFWLRSTLVNAFEESDDKKGFLSLLKILINKYEIFADEISLPQIISALKTKNLPFTITGKQWPQTFEALKK